MLERITHMLIKEFIQIFRDPRMRTVIFLMPLLQTLVFGYAVTTDVTHIPTAVFDLDNSRASRELAARFTGSGYFDVVEYPDREEQVRKFLDQGRVKVVLRVNKGFGDDLRTGRTAPLQIIVDGTDSNTAGIVLNYAGQIAGRFSELVLQTRFVRATGQPAAPPRVVPETRAWFNENLESRNFYVPGAIVLIVTSSP